MNRTRLKEQREVVRVTKDEGEKLKDRVKRDIDTGLVGIIFISL